MRNRTIMGGAVICNNLPDTALFPNLLEEMLQY